MLVYLLWTIIFTHKAVAIPVDNSIDGQPIINCGSDEIELTFNTRNEFQGRLYVKGLAEKNDCQNAQTGRKTTGINLFFDSCNVQRLRSLNPKGIFASTTIVISFHPLFVTKIDRTYNVQCFYMEADKQLTENIQVSDLTTAFISQPFPMPICRYEILANEPNGNPVDFAVVGQQVYHKFLCDTETQDTFCMIVNSCFVENELGKKVEILDSNGCALDKFLLSNLEYVNDLQAGQEAHIFKFADQPSLFFQCQISLKLKEPQTECNRPICPSNKFKRQLNDENLVVDVSSRKIQIVELLELHERTPHQLSNKSNCVSTQSIAMAGLFLLCWCVTVSAIVFFNSKKQKTYVVSQK